MAAQMVKPYLPLINAEKMVQVIAYLDKYGNSIVGKYSINLNKIFIITGKL